MVETRRAILEALAAEIAASGIAGMSIQAVADRAGVTHRTVYNYFPTRESLNDAFAEHVEQVLAEQAKVSPDEDVGLAELPAVAARTQALFDAHAAHLQAYVMMTIATGAAPRVFRDRSIKYEKLVEGELGPLEPGAARLVVAAVRMFISSTGWFLLSKHHGLNADEAGRVTEWAVEVLLDAARSGRVPRRSTKGRKKRA